MKKSYTIVIIMVISACFGIVGTASAGNTVGVIIPESQIEQDDFFNLTVWVDCEDEIDGFFIRNFTWSPDCVDVVSVEPGWWDWLWDPGHIYDAGVSRIQAGSKTKTTGNHTACIIRCQATAGGNCVFSFIDMILISGGPSVSCEILSAELNIMGDVIVDDDDDAGGGGQSGGKPAEPPVDESGDGNGTLRQSNDIVHGIFTFKAMESGMEGPFVGPVLPDGPSDDPEEDVVLVAWWEIVVFAGAMVCCTLIAVFILIKRRRRDEPGS